MIAKFKFCASLNCFDQAKIASSASSASTKKIMPAQNLNSLNGNHVLVWHKHFGLAQNILGPVEEEAMLLLRKYNILLDNPKKNLS